MGQGHLRLYMINILNKKLTTYIILALIVIIGTFLRFHQLGVNPPSLNWDEASLGYNAYSILKTGADEYGNRLPLSIRSFDDYKPALYAYLDILPIFLFGLNEFAVRLPAAIFGVFTVIAVYFLTKEILSKTVSLITAFLFAISPWHLQFSRAAFEGNIGLFFFIAGLLFFFKALKNGSFFYLSSVLFLLSLYSYHSFRLFVPLFLLALLVIFFRRILNFKKQAIISLVILLLLSFPIWNSFLGTGVGTGARLSMVTIFSDPTVIIPSILAGIYYLLRKYNRLVLILFMSFLLAPISASITTGTPHPVRAIGMVLGFHIFTAAGVVFLWEKIMLLKNPLVKISIIFIIISSLLLNAVYYLHQYYVHTPVEYGYFWQYGYKEVFEEIGQIEDKYSKIVMTYMYDQPYIYYLFYNKIDPSWYQKNWDKNLKNTLFIGMPKEIPNNAKIIKEIKFLDGSIAFRIAQT